MGRQAGMAGQQEGKRAVRAGRGMAELGEEYAGTQEERGRN